ncbi:MAG: type II toxin-antitoxin system YafQ family toxin [Patescibacteria group bacterium]|nr:type II toxin-antitoxin system YafQ family toxin [Patescibacteria group bacterium]
MYTILRTKDFERSFKRLTNSGLKQNKKKVIGSVIDKIASGSSLDKKYKDHSLSGEFSGYRECHIFNDLLLIYKIDKKAVILVLIDIGSHSQLFG